MGAPECRKAYGTNTPESQRRNCRKSDETELANTTIRDTSVLKKLTGRQPTRIQRKNQRAYDVRLYAKLWFNANRIPATCDESDAFFRRKVIISFPNRFEGKKDDPDIVKKLTTDEELSGIFNVLMIALRTMVYL